MLALTVLLLTSIGLQLVSPQFIRRFIDIAQEQGSLGALYAAATTFLLLGVVTQVVALVAKYIGANVGWLATNRLRSELTLHLLRLDMPFHNERTPGQLIERVDSDITRLANFFSFFIVRLVGGLLLTSGVLVVLFFEDYRLGLVLTAFVVVYLVVHFMGQRLAVPFVKAEREASADYYGFLSESFQAVKDIQTGGASEHMTRRFHSFVRPLFATQWKMDFVFSTSWAVSNTVAALGFTAALGVGAYLFQNGAITVGTVYLVIRYLNIIQFPLVQISREVQDLQRAQVSIGRVRELLEIQPGIKDGSGASFSTDGPAAEFRQVSFGYSADIPVLHDLSFSVEPGRVMGVLGRTGSGKTTISRLLFRLYEPSQGSVVLGGADIRDVGIEELRRRVGMVTQEVQVFQATVRENLRMFDDGIPDSEIVRTISELGLEHWLRRQPGGLDTELAPGGGQLSAGEAQLLAFARVFLKDPDLVVLDEASSRLDFVTERLTQRAVKRLMENRTGIIIAHRLETVMDVDDVMILENGRIQELGSRRDLVGDSDSRLSQLLRTGLEEVLT